MEARAAHCRMAGLIIIIFNAVRSMVVCGVYVAWRYSADIVPVLLAGAYRHYTGTIASCVGIEISYLVKCIRARQVPGIDCSRAIARVLSCCTRDNYVPGTRYILIIISSSGNYYQVDFFLPEYS